MEAKQKAKELFDKIDIIIYTDQDNWKSQCIRCALLAVDEIIIFMDYSDLHNDFWFEYWLEVKQELNKL
jgi:hypothetical protein